MAFGHIDPALRQQLGVARARAGTPLSRDEVAEVLAEVVRSMSGDVSALDLKLYSELESLARYIQSARREIAAIRPDEIREEHIPRATDELDAVVGATERATGTILDVCEEISAISARVPAEEGAALTDAVMRVYEACNFQDITGQRITKVVRTLKHIETKVDALLAAFGEEIERARGAKGKDADGAAPAEADLLSGPQLPGQAIDQDAIDALFASLD